MKKDEKSCQNCRYFRGWDGGFFGLPFTTDCDIFGNTENRKGCSRFKRPFPKGFYLLLEFSEWVNSKNDCNIDYEDIVQFWREWE